MGLPTTVVEPTEAHTHTVVFLHGRGDTAKNFSEAMRYSTDSKDISLFQRFPSFRWVFPQAPTTTCAGFPSQAWPQWFDTWSTANLKYREENQAAGLKENVPKIRALLAKEAALLDNRWERVVLAGISMGGATCGHVLLNLHVPANGRLGAVLAFSARCPFGESSKTTAEIRAVLGVAEDIPSDSQTLHTTPVLIEHCADDPVINISNGRLLRDVLQRAGATVTWKEYRVGDHWINSPEGVDDAVAFLRKHVLSQDDGSADAGAAQAPKAEP